MTKRNEAGLTFALMALVTSFAASAAMPTAACRPSGDRPESGMSGETTAAERAGAAFQGFKCNTDLVGQYQGEGASWQLTAWKNCAYFDQRNNAAAGSTTETHPGSVVMDVSDPTHPVPTTWLNEPSMIDPWESIKVNPARQLLAGDQRPLASGQPGDGFSVYDISGDCKNPVSTTLANPVHLPGSLGHTGQWAPDGKTYYVTPLQNTPSIVAVDVTDPANPAEIPGGLYTFKSTELPLPRLHDSEFSKDGNTAYVTMFGVGATAAANGLGIIDVSDFQQRRASPAYRVISKLTWDDGSIGAQNALPLTIAGKPYILVTDEGGGGAAGCAQGKSANGFPRLVDISDPTHPAVVSKLQLGVADPANCTAISTAPITSSYNSSTGVQTTGPGFFAHSCHYCNVDDPDNAKVLACSCFASGLRIIDIHDPANPKEMAYYKPPAQGTKVLPASQYAPGNAASGPGGAPYNRPYDYTTAKVSFPKDRGQTSGDIWITSHDNGFQVIKLFSAIAVSPRTLATGHDQTESFKSTVTGAAATGGTVWTIQEGAAGGTIEPNGTYHAPSTGGTYHIVATALLDSSKTDTATVTVYGAKGGCTSGEASLSAALALGVFLMLRRRRTHA